MEQNKGQSLMIDDANSYFNSKEFKNLLEQYEDAQRDGKSIYIDASDIANIADHYLNEQEFIKSKKIIDYGLSMYPNDSLMLILKAKLMLYKGDISAARVISESIPCYGHDILYLKGDIELKENNDKLADTYYTQAYESSDDNISLLHDIIIGFMYDHKYKYAQKWIDQAIRLHPDSRIINELQADFLFYTNDYDMAVEAYNRLLDEFPFDNYYWSQLGTMYYDRNDFSKAKECFEFAYIADEKDDTALFMKGLISFQLEQWKDALDIFRKFLNNDKHNSDNDSALCYYYCGICFFHLDQQENALDNLLKAATMFTDNYNKEYVTETYETLFKIYLNLNNPTEAEHYLRLGLALDPYSEELNNQLKKIKNL